MMDDFDNDAIRDIVVQCAAKSAKTPTVVNSASWAIAEKPGPAMWVTAARDELRNFRRDRRTPTFEDVPHSGSRLWSFRRGHTFSNT
ncbi:MAG: phage terminase large subunit family protein [Verrucomicrobiales bacterium]|nr:phage terminase large subunit family protein [Verrucomicrobiales bacterium]